MKFEELRKKVLEWAHEKGIIAKATPLAQGMKTLEEVCELLNALRSDDMPEIIDAYGDIQVTIIIGCELLGLHPLECLESAYDVIKNRTGIMLNGTFVKSEDLA